MRGKHHIIIENNRVRYEFSIKRNITIIRGDSATGKTALIEMLAEYQSYGKTSGISVMSDCRIAVLDNRDWQFVLERYTQTIIFIDEGCRFVATQEFASKVKNSDNYFVIVTRESLANLPYSVEEIYGIRISQKYSGLKKTYNELYHLYGNLELLSGDKIDKIIVEDSNSGFEFYKEAVTNREIEVVSAGGKSNMAVMADTETKNTLYFADGAAFGSEMNHFETMLLLGKRFVLYLPESFEWLVLASGLLEDKEIEEILRKPEGYIDSRNYFSWERFFTKLLVEKSKDGYLKYQKERINQAYLRGMNREKIVAVLPREIQKLFDG